MLKRKIAVMVLVSSFVVSNNAVEAKHRSDASIYQDVDHVIDTDPSLDDDVSITVDNGYVTLDGTVDNRAEKDLAQKLVSNVSGVHQVNNRLYVEYNTRAPNNGATKANNEIKIDREICRDIERRLFLSSEFDSRKINTSVNDGKVTFTGTVHQGSDMRLIEQKAREAGASRIVNMLEISDSGYKASL